MLLNRDRVYQNIVNVDNDEIRKLVKDFINCSLTCWQTKNAFGEENKAYPKNMGYLIAADPFHQILYSKKLVPFPTKSIIADIKLLEKHPKDYTLP